MDKAVEATLKSLCSRNIHAIFAEDSKNANDVILDLVPAGAVVGIGDSTTVAQIGVKKELRRRGNRVLDGYDRGTEYGSSQDRRRLVEESTISDVFLTGTNAITQDGKLVNVDAAGNRVAGMIWGHQTTIIVAGRNKIVKNLDEAFHRLREMIAPTHIRIRTELGGRPVSTPCVKTGECKDCKTKDRMCNIFTIVEGKPLRREMMVVIVDEDLGLGWDETWSPERIAKIVQSYKESVWIPYERFV